MGHLLDSCQGCLEQMLEEQWVQCIQLKGEFRSVANNQGLEQTEERGEYHQGEDLLEGQGQVKDGLLKEQDTVAGVEVVILTEVV